MAPHTAKFISKSHRNAPEDLGQRPWYFSESRKRLFPMDNRLRTVGLKWGLGAKKMGDSHLLSVIVFSWYLVWCKIPVAHVRTYYISFIYLMLNMKWTKRKYTNLFYFPVCQFPWKISSLENMATIPTPGSLDEFHSSQRPFPLHKYHNFPAPHYLLSGTAHTC